MTMSRTFDTIVANHRAVRRFLAMAETAPDEVLAAQLAWLRIGLPQHFAVEEQPGGFLDAVEARPGLAQVGRALRAEHRRLHAELVAIDAGHQRGEPVTALLRAFARALGAHEAHEAALGLDLEDRAVPRK